MRNLIKYALALFRPGGEDRRDAPEAVSADMIPPINVAVADTVHCPLLVGYRGLHSELLQPACDPGAVDTEITLAQLGT